MEPWLEALAYALRHRHVPQIFLLVSLREAKQLTRGTVSKRLMHQVDSLLTFIDEHEKERRDGRTARQENP